jgi:hypothetical protein
VLLLNYVLLNVAFWAEDSSSKKHFERIFVQSVFSRYYSVWKREHGTTPRLTSSTHEAEPPVPYLALYIRRIAPKLQIVTDFA